MSGRVKDNDVCDRRNDDHQTESLASDLWRVACI
jgi:hypothetical protein